MTEPSDEAVEHARALLESLGLDETVDSELEATPERFVGLLRTLFAGVDADPPTLSTFPVDAAEPADAPAGKASIEPISLLGLSFQSMCVHHLVPMYGIIDVAYVPDERLVGFGSVGRAIDHVCSRPQLQEDIVAQLADLLAGQIEPAGLLVRCRARQLCMEMRGAQKRGVLVASAARGSLRDGPLRTELLKQFSEATTPI